MGIVGVLWVFNAFKGCFRCTSEGFRRLHGVLGAFQMISRGFRGDPRSFVGEGLRRHQEHSRSFLEGRSFPRRFSEFQEHFSGVTGSQMQERSRNF